PVYPPRRCPEGRGRPGLPLRPPPPPAAPGPPARPRRAARSRPFQRRTPCPPPRPAAPPPRAPGHPLSAPSADHPLSSPSGEDLAALVSAPTTGTCRRTPQPEHPASHDHIGPVGIGPADAPWASRTHMTHTGKAAHTSDCTLVLAA